MDDNQNLVIHFTNLCDCEQCAEIRVAQAEQRLYDQLEYHDREEDICCGDCPKCWHHY